jgi:hypothetical protein
MANERSTSIVVALSNMQGLTNPFLSIPTIFIMVYSSETLDTTTRLATITTIRFSTTSSTNNNNLQKKHNYPPNLQ